MHLAFLPAFRQNPAVLGKIILCAGVILSITTAPATHLDWTPPGTNAMEDISAFLEPHLERLQSPALAAAVFSRDHILAAGVTGLRKLGDETLVTLHDKFHIGSVTKGITSLLAVMLAEEGKVALTNRISDLLDDEVRDDYQKLTLAQLLQHRSGLPKQPPPDLWEKAWQWTTSGSGAEQRARFVPEVLLLEPEVTPDTRYLYSNLGYSVAGAMLETTMERDWEDLVREYIFAPLAMHSADFGPPATPGQVDQPWGHTWRDGKLEIEEPSDNPSSIGPGGTVHCTLLDLARYGAFHIALARGDIEELKAWRDELYTPPAGQDYALGWMVLERGWAHGRALTHNGSNTMFFCVIWLAPERDRGFIVMTNAGNVGDSSSVQDGADQVVGALIKRFLPAE